MLEGPDEAKGLRLSRAMPASWFRSKRNVDGDMQTSREPETIGRLDASDVATTEAACRWAAARL
jgi:hypothetical protein